MPQILAGENKWMCQNKVSVGSWFTGNYNFTLTGGDPEITILAYREETNIKDSLKWFPIVPPITSPVPDDPRYYSGYGDGFINTTDTINLKASELVNHGKYFLINHKDSFLDLKINRSFSPSDLIPITQDEEKKTYSSINGANLGNWSAQNYYTFTLDNDTLSSIIFEGYIKADFPTNLDMNNEETSAMVIPIITTKNQFKSAHLNRNYVKSNKCNTWKWLSQTLKPGDKLTDTIQFILGTNSTADQRMMFVARNVTEV